MKLTIVPMTFREARQFVREHHRHNPNVTGCKFAIGCQDESGLVGVAICGRPVGRRLDNGRTLEINRVCTNGAANACSMLYGACCRIAKHMGYERVITYTLESETGASLRASNFVCEGLAGGLEWTGKRGTGKNGPNEMKRRWVKRLKE